jgi:predicted transcriptional regulator
MVASQKSLFELTAAELQTRILTSLPADMPLRDAAKMLFDARVHGAPVVDESGRCVGVLSISDIARWAVHMSGPTMAHPRTCGFQETHRGPAGREVTHCTLPEGKCPFQSSRRGPEGEVFLECREPHSVLMEWQMVEMEAIPTEHVRHYMTTEPVLVDARESIFELARKMVNSVVQRVIVVDGEQRPTGIVTVTDLVAALAAVHEDEMR